MQVLPAKKYIVCTDVGQEETSAGIQIPTMGDQKQKPELGIVVEVGLGTPPLQIKKGDTIIYKRYMANEISIAGERFNFIAFDDVVGKVKK